MIDWYSRKVLSWRLSNSMDASFCVDCLEDALGEHGKPDVFNCDEGTQFRSKAFTDVFKREGVDISMDGRGRARDNIFVERLWRNVKYEDVYLKGYANMAELMVGLAQYFAFYNAGRPHQLLGYETPACVYRSGVGGGARIVDKYGSDEVARPETAECSTPCRRQPMEDQALQRPESSITGRRRPAVVKETDTV
ncbi:Mobile element protein [Janthinobacterium sp. CG23_2]|nr:Mobile element protein [Janthinobacterium sp. CG23_2]CUU29527.1 Mobile element protein [Janthinobacterium sp. CG23_2]